MIGNFVSIEHTIFFVTISFLTIVVVIVCWNISWVVWVHMIEKKVKEDSMET